MISKQDILDRATEWQLRPSVVEKDYVLGWLLAALASHPASRALWVLKGGTCIKKCYVETYRFSEDLDFSLLPEAPYTEAAIRETLETLAGIASELSGIDFPENYIQVRARHDRLGRPTFEGRIAYRGPMGIPSRFEDAFPRVRFDITHHEPVLDPPNTRISFHPYPDTLPAGLGVLTYSVDELLAEKLRALYERTLPRDLYDVVYLLENQPYAFDFQRVGNLFEKKCTAKHQAVFHKIRYAHPAVLSCASHIPCTNRALCIASGTRTGRILGIKGCYRHSFLHVSRMDTDVFGRRVQGYSIANSLNN